MLAYWRSPISEVYGSMHFDNLSYFTTWEHVDVPLSLKRALDSLEADRANQDTFYGAFSELSPLELLPLVDTFYETFFGVAPSRAAVVCPTTVFEQPRGQFPQCPRPYQYYGLSLVLSAPPTLYQSSSQKGTQLVFQVP